MDASHHPRRRTQLSSAFEWSLPSPSWCPKGWLKLSRPVDVGYPGWGRLARMKERNPSNRIGHRGESEFRAFASRHGLLPTKVEDDYGVDFICFVDEDAASRRTTRVSGAVIGVAVRASGRDGRVRLTRKDAVALLRAEFPIAFVVVHLVADTPAFHHRVLDPDFAEALAAFLDSGRSTYSVTPATCRPGDAFGGDVRVLLAAGTVERRRVEVAERRVRHRINGVSVEVRRSRKGALTVVTALNLYDYFDQLDEQARDRLHLATFGHPERQQERLTELAVRQDLLDDLSELPEPLVLGGFTAFAEVELRVRHNAQEAVCGFSYTSNGTHSGYVHPAGFALTISGRKQVGGDWVHELGAFADPHAPLDPREVPDLNAFLRLCRPDARIERVGTDAGTFAVSHFGGLTLYGSYAACASLAATIDGWDRVAVDLRDATDEETLTTFAWLAALAEDPIAVSRLAFVTSERDESTFEQRPAIWTTPVVANTKSGSVVVELSCDGTQYVEEGGSLVGFRAEQVQNIRVTPEGRLSKASKWPEFVLGPSGPVIAVTERGWSQVEPIVDPRIRSGFESDGMAPRQLSQVITESASPEAPEISEAPRQRRRPRQTPPPPPPKKVAARRKKSRHGRNGK